MWENPVVLAEEGNFDRVETDIVELDHDKQGQFEVSLLLGGELV